MIGPVQFPSYDETTGALNLRIMGCAHSEAVAPSDSKAVAYRVVFCTSNGTLQIKCTSDTTSTPIVMTAGASLRDFAIVRVMAATTGDYVGGW
jgi:hypothetical protein